MPYTEEKYENTIIQLFEEMGYTHAYGPAIDRDYKTPLYMDEKRPDVMLFINGLPVLLMS